MNMKVSFQMSYIILLTTATITFIESMRTDKPLLRHIFNLETCVSLVAGYFYSLFLEKLKYFEETKQKIDWKEMTLLRYMDWVITTPMMLIALCASLAYNIKKPVVFFPVLVIIALNYVMLGLGYLGEINSLDKVTAATSSFVAFFAMFGVIYYYFVSPKYHCTNRALYSIFLFIWSMYGVVYFFQEEAKNICLNILDVLSKGLVGIGLWMYFTNVVA
jgi:hypothetical protein